MSVDKSLPPLTKVRWMCRRGLLELDLILLEILDKHYSDFSQDEKLAFVYLLDLKDPQLLRYLLGYESFDDTDYPGVIKLLHTLISAEVISS